MFKTENKKAQAAIELAVFGAILVFILGTIVRSAAGNGYSQNQNFKAMRMAMLASWQGSEAGQGEGALANTARNSASILFVEDRLSPDLTKYGDIDRNPNTAQGSGTFSYNLLYPWTPGVDSPSSLIPIMDIYINGQHFPFSTAALFDGVELSPPSCSGSPTPPPTDGGQLSQAACLENQCLRNAREWVGAQTIQVSQFDIPSIAPTSPVIAPCTTQACQETANAGYIFQELIREGFVGTVDGNDTDTSGYVTGASPVLPATFAITYPTGQQVTLTPTEISNIEAILKSAKTGYKLFYTMVPNGTAAFSPTPPAPCSGTACLDKALTSNLVVNDANGKSFTNTNGDMQYDLLRLGNYTASLGAYPSVEAQFPVVPSCAPTTPGEYPPNMRCYIAWQWAASAATSATAIGFDSGSNEFPTYDIDGRLKEVTIYGFSVNASGYPVVSYEDFQGGDIDGSWDTNSCTPKPGLQNNSQIYTFTKQGTFLKIKEGKLFNPETDQFVRSVNQRDTIDLIQRQIQLSNNTGRFCSIAKPTQICSATDGDTGVSCANPNPVEACVDSSAGAENCFSADHIGQTCYDVNPGVNTIYVRSRLEDRRGNFWMTDTSGQLQVK